MEGLLMTQTAVVSPGYVVGSWSIDPVHSDVSFLVRHMMVSKVRGRFADFDATLHTAADPLESQVEASIKLDSITTGNDQRDSHIRSADFFEVETYPEMTYRSTGLRPDGENYILEGELTLKGVTRSVPLSLEVTGFGPDAYGGTRSGFSATGTINRRDFGVSFQIPMEGGGVVIGDKITINIEAEFVLNQN
jgi:polyisoprenoid-binding protein YceI